MIGKFRICKQCECVDVFMKNGKCTVCNGKEWHGLIPYKHISTYTQEQRIHITNGLEYTQSLMFNQTWQAIVSNGFMLTQTAPNNN